VSLPTPIRLAVIGAGHLGRIHARLASSLAGARLVGVADVSERARAEVAAELEVPTVDDYRKLIGGIDAAILATPTSTHCPIGCELLEAGVPLFIEKPLASCVVEAEWLVQLAHDRGLVLQVGHVERFNPAFEAARAKLDDVKYVSAERLSEYPARGTDVGVVLDLMIHDLDIVQSVVSAPVRRVEALGVAVVGPHEDLATARLEFANGCIANLTASRVSYVSRRVMHLFTPAGHVALDFAARHGKSVSFNEALPDVYPARRESVSRHLSPQPLTVSESNAIAAEQREFVASVRGEGRPRVPGTAGLETIAVAERILDSIARHQWDGHDSGRIGPNAIPAELKRLSAA
jgi:predicted dehydrogenase